MKKKNYQKNKNPFKGFIYLYVNSMSMFNISFFLTIFRAMLLGDVISSKKYFQMKK